MELPNAKAKNLRICRCQVGCGQWRTQLPSNAPAIQHQPVVATGRCQPHIDKSILKELRNVDIYVKSFNFYMLATN